MTGLAKSAPPAGITRWFLRMPIWLYRLGLGWILGKGFLLLTHRGRRSRQWRRTVVEVVARGEDGKTFYISSGWGEKSNWLQNIQKDPEIHIQIGRQRFHGLATRLPRQQAADVLLKYAMQNPVAFQRLSKMMLGEQPLGSEETCRKLAEVAPVVELKVTAPG